MGAQGGCSVSCPTGATHNQLEGGLRACWYEIDDQRWRSVHRGELKVRLRHPRPKAKGELHTFAFVMIQDPKEVWPGKRQGRFGDWRLHIKPEHWPTAAQKARQDANMLLRWRLRDRPDGLSATETVQLMASWRQNGQRQHRALRGLYHQEQGVVEAFLPASLQYKPDLSLFPIRVNKASPMAQAHRKHLASATH